MEAVLRQGLLPDVITYSVLVSACGQGALQQRASQLLEESRRAFDVRADMLRKDMKHTMVSYSEVTSASAKGE